MLASHILSLLTGLSLAWAAPTTSSPLRDTWYLPTTDGAAKLFVEEIGPRDAPPVIVLHGGWGAEHSYLDDVVTPQAGPQHRFVLYDQRGSLLSPVKSTGSLTLQQQIDDLDLLRRTLGISKVTVLAHSMGTYLAFAYAQAHPDNVAALILTGTIPAKTPPGGADAFWKSANDQAGQLIARREVAQQLALLAQLHEPPPQAITHRWRVQFAAVNLYHVERWRSMPGGMAFYNQAAADAISATMPKAWDFEPLLSEGRIKISLIDGEQDYVDPGQSYWRAAAARFPRLHLTVLHHAQHSAWIDNPAGFDAALAAAFLK